MANENHAYNSHTLPRCLMSMNNSCPKVFTYPPIIRGSLYTVIGFVILLTVLGNSLVIITVLHFKMFHTPTNYLILSLAVADALVGALVMPSLMIITVESCWYTGPLHCKMYLGLGATLLMASIMNICFIAIDRYFAVCHPLKYQTTITTSLVTQASFVGWSVAATSGFCSSFLLVQNINMEIGECEGVCFVRYTKLSAIVPIFGMYCPGFIMICVYAKIYKIAKRQARLIHDNHTECAKKSNTTRKTEIKATRTLIIVMGVFLSLWLPFTFGHLIHPFTSYSIPLRVMMALAWVGCMNSMLNPFIYAIFYSWYRRAFKVVLCGRMFHAYSSNHFVFSE